jgi:hypothetical protein
MHTMTDVTERRLGWGFGLLGAALIAVGAVVMGIAGIADAVEGRSADALAAGSFALVLLVAAALAGLFAHLGYRAWSDRPLVSGILLVVVAVVGWAALGLGANVFALVGALFVFLAGVLYVLGPAIDGARRVLAPA